MNRWRLDGKVALVTGASGGIGARRQDAMKAVADDICATGGRCETVALDVADAASTAAIQPILNRVDIVVNNAGIVRR